MTPALVLRTVPREGRPCHERKRARVDQDATVRAVRDATGFHASASLARALDFTVDSHGAPIVRYGFSVEVSGREWAGSGQPKDAELMNAGNWRTTST